MKVLCEVTSNPDCYRTPGRKGVVIKRMGPRLTCWELKNLFICGGYIATLSLDYTLGAGKYKKCRLVTGYLNI